MKGIFSSSSTSFFKMIIYLSLSLSLVVFPCDLIEWQEQEKCSGEMTQKVLPFAQAFCYHWYYSVAISFYLWFRCIISTMFENHRKCLTHFELSKLKNSLQMPYFDDFLKTWILRSNSVTRQVYFNRPKISEKCQISKIQMSHFW